MTKRKTDVASGAKSKQTKRSEPSYLDFIKISLGETSQIAQIDYVQKICGIGSSDLALLKTFAQRNLEAYPNQGKELEKEKFELLQEYGFTFTECVDKIFVPKDNFRLPAPKEVSGDTFFLPKDNLICIYYNDLHLRHCDYRAFKAFRVKPLGVEAEEESVPEVLDTPVSEPSDVLERGAESDAKLTQRIGVPNLGSDDLPSDQPTMGGVDSLIEASKLLDLPRWESAGFNADSYALPINLGSSPLGWDWDSYRLPPAGEVSEIGEASEMEAIHTAEI